MCFFHSGFCQHHFVGVQFPKTDAHTVFILGYFLRFVHLIDEVPSPERRSDKRIKALSSLSSAFLSCSAANFLYRCYLALPVSPCGNWRPDRWHVNMIFSSLWLLSWVLKTSSRIHGSGAGWLFSVQISEPSQFLTHFGFSYQRRLLSRNLSNILYWDLSFPGYRP